MDTPPVSSQTTWFVYIILASDESLYTGISTDIERRFAEHSDGRGAKYFRGRKPVRVCYREHCQDRSTALKRELHIKKLSKCKKNELIDQYGQ